MHMRSRKKAMIFWSLGAELLVLHLLHGKSFECPCLFKTYSERCYRLSENPELHIGVLEAGQDLSADPFVKSAGASLNTSFCHLNVP
jgi:hypothetical protein